MINPVKTMLDKMRHQDDIIKPNTTQIGHPLDKQEEWPFSLEEQLVIIQY